MLVATGGGLIWLTRAAVVDLTVRKIVVPLSPNNRSNGAVGVVVARTGLQGVVTGTAVEHVVPGTGEGVVAVEAAQHVVAGAADETVHPVVPTTTWDPASDGGGLDQLVAAVGACPVPASAIACAHTAPPGRWWWWSGGSRQANT